MSASGPSGPLVLKKHGDIIHFCRHPAKIVSEYDQEIQQSQTADKPTVP